MDNRRRFRANSNNLSAAGGVSLPRIIFSKVGIALVPIRRNASSAFFHPGELKGGRRADLRISIKDCDWNLNFLALLDSIPRRTTGTTGWTPHQPTSFFD